jgi:ABC-type multidrug transport system fused ATPase/permease subunit
VEEARNGRFREVLSLFFLLSKEAKIKYLFMAICQPLLTILDVMAVYFLTVLSGKVLFGFSNETNPLQNVFPNLWFFNDFKELINLGSIRELTLVTVGLVLFKQIISLTINWLVFRMLAGELSRVSTELYKRVQDSNYQTLRTIDRTRIRFVFSQALPNVFLGSLTQFLTLFSDGILVVFIFVILISVNYQFAFFIFVFYFAFYVFVLGTFGRKTRSISFESSKNAITELQLTHELVSVFPENFLYYNKDRMNQKYANHKYISSNKFSQLLWFQQSPKYLYEFTAIALTVAGLYFVGDRNSSQLISTLLIFIVALSRIVPAVQRSSQAALSFRASAGALSQYWALHESLTPKRFPQIDASKEAKLDLNELGIEIEVRNLCYRYPDTDNNVLEKIDFKVLQGEFFAVIGPSGAGKSTLMEILMGLTAPTSGEVVVNGFDIDEWHGRFQGKIAYIPQSIQLIRGTIGENVKFDYSLTNSLDEEKIFEALRQSFLLEEVQKLPNGIQTELDPENPSLSGGQIQRLGIARALFKNPRLILLDESTSSLDVYSEEKIERTLQNLRGRCTVVCIAHKPGTLKNVDRILYLSNGRQHALGTLTQLNLALPNNDLLASLKS